MALVTVLSVTALVQTRVRGAAANSGDEFLFLVTLTVFVQSLPSSTVLASPLVVQKAALFFILAQGVLSYFTAGVSKIRGGWGDGKS